MQRSKKLVELSEAQMDKVSGGIFKYDNVFPNVGFMGITETNAFFDGLFDQGPYLGDLGPS